jgi:hypothetical protein
MHRRRIFLTLGLLAAGWPVCGEAATEEAFTCRRGQEERRVELQSADAAERVPCQVLYWRDAARPGNGQAMWQADHDFGFCIERTRDLVQRLEEGGWSCEKTAPPSSAAQSTTAVAPRAVAPPPAADRAKLDQALARDLKRLAELSASPGGRFEVQSARLGDLNRDGVDDAAVLMTYRTEKPETAQFLVAYRFDGETFRPAARIYLGRPGADVRASDIAGIADGTIMVLLQVRQPGDPECCPSGSRRDGYVLKDGHLVELGAGAGT